MGDKCSFAFKYFLNLYIARSGRGIPGTVRRAPYHFFISRTIYFLLIH